MSLIQKCVKKKNNNKLVLSTQLAQVTQVFPVTEKPYIISSLARASPKV